MRIVLRIAFVLSVLTATTPARAWDDYDRPTFGSGLSSIFGSSSLVSEARRYMGTNPTGRKTLWCGAFMDMVLKRTGRKGGGNLAKGYLKYGKHLAGPVVGAIAIFSRGKKGGHVGVVTGIDGEGNPVIISGNHNNTVAEVAYPRGRVLGYVMPG